MSTLPNRQVAIQCATKHSSDSLLIPRSVARFGVIAGKGVLCKKDQAALATLVVVLVENIDGVDEGGGGFRGFIGMGTITSVITVTGSGGYQSKTSRN